MARLQGASLIRHMHMTRPAKLLVVDDNPVVLLGFSELLRSAGYEVLEARTASEGLHAARNHAPDLILLDVVLPDFSGVELCRKIKDDPEFKHLFIVLLSSSEVSPDSKVTGLDAGADGYIVRPIENRELCARVQALLRIQQAEAALHRAHDQLEARVRERTNDLAAANARLRAMSLRLVEVQEAERRCLARELHDELGQVLTGLKMELDQSLPLAGGPLRTRLQEAVGLVNHLLQSVRSLSLELRPQMLDDLGLLVALDWHLKRYTKQTSIPVEFKRTELPDRLAPELETAIYRIVQEALTNVARHSCASQTTVRLWANAGRVGVQIADNGTGFDAAAADPRHTSSGLTGMRERAELLGGEFTLESKPGQGTTLTVELPLAAANRSEERL